MKHDRSPTIRRLRCTSTGQHFVQVEALQVDGKTMAKVLLPLATASNRNALKDALINAGFSYPLKLTGGGLMADFMDHVPDVTGVLADVVGWHGPVGAECFLTPREVIGDTDGVHYQVKKPSNCLACRTSGTLTEWSANVAMSARGSDISMAAILASLSGPLQFLAATSEGGILNIAGRSSTGKSTAVALAASVWGNPADIARWNGTERGLIEAAAANSDMALILDDIEQADPDPTKRMATLIRQTHLLTSGKGKIYSAKAASDDLRDLSFRNVTISSSPETVEEYTRRRNMTRTDGDRVRLMELEVPTAKEGGIWASGHSAKDKHTAGERSDQIRLLARKHYGTAGPALVNHVVENRAKVADQIEKYTDKFITRAGATNTELERRIASKIALFYAAGRISVQAGILPWDKGDVRRVSEFAYNAVLSSSGLKDRQAKPINYSQLFDAQDDDLPEGNQRPTAFQLNDHHVGYHCADEGLIYIRRDHFRRKLEKLSHRTLSSEEYHGALEALCASGGLHKGDKGGATKTVRFASGKARMLVFDAGKFEAFALSQPKRNPSTRT